MNGRTGVGPSSYFDNTRINELDSCSADLVRRRNAALGPAYRLFYERPLHLVRGEGVHLYDRDGREYLDFYNNVAGLGHCHPAVVDAICAQARTLSTHTRYLDESIIGYAEQLLATMPVGIDHAMFTCTGSEAGDLALRVAQSATGHRGAIVTRNAYHGVTGLTAALSPSLRGADRLPSWVRLVDPPDTYRTGGAAPSEIPHRFATDVEAAIDDLRREGHGFAALIMDSVLCSDGVFVGDGNLLTPARDLVAAAGGLYIADEVQAGFGRLGHGWWGFDGFTQSGAAFTPDLVVLGKPMGNGMPVAAVAMRAELITAFARGQRYFNTFAGNATAIAAAQAVLDVTRDQGLIPQAQTLGERLRRAVQEVAREHPRIGDVRGAGLFLGIEFEDGDDGPAEAFTLAVVNHLRDRGVLVATTGARNNVLKVRPPLVSAPRDIDRFAAELDHVMRTFER
jgi:4-aminobutyrate aminotransferase-like enzyme